ncbi:MAG: helix-turn-helix transcriptional regulator [Ornithinimicrobium sp.]|uniref:helix-turn-helix transcriptional regulator n=1 Tax=Ornithinimicrobium sp. TaxID=1977084 RepID=UPI003D9B4ABC
MNDQPPTAKSPDQGVALARIGGLLDLAEAELGEQHRRVVQLRGSLESYEQDRAAGTPDHPARLPPFEEVTPTTASEIVQMAARTSPGDVRQVTARVQTGPEHDPSVIRARREGIHAGRAVHTVFRLDVLTDPAWRDWVHARAADGERQRFVEDIDLQFVVFGSSVVLVEEGPEPDADSLLIRVPIVVQAFTALFEEYWRRGELALQADLSAQTRGLVELLAMGFKDEAIARHLGVGLRTVRRRVADLVDGYGVRTRFQLGLEIGRRGQHDQPIT